MTTVSAIVPTINRPSSLRRLLNSLAAQTVKVDEVIVADASLGDESNDVATDPCWRRGGLNVSRIRVLPPNAVRQREAAIGQALGDFLLLLDDDVQLEVDCVEEMLRLFASQTGVVGVFANFNNQVWSHPTKLWRLYMRYVLKMPEGTWQGRVVGPLLRFAYNPVPDKPQPIEWIGAGNSMIRRVAFDAVGGFSDFFLHRCTVNEDVDLGIKLGQTGRLLFCPTARMAHHHAPGGRVSTITAAEDDLYNRYRIMRLSQKRSRFSAVSSVLCYCAIESISSCAACLRPEYASRGVAQLIGRLRALIRLALRQ